jgi:hypothetical protein
VLSQPLSEQYIATCFQGHGQFLGERRDIFVQKRPSSASGEQRGTRVEDSKRPIVKKQRGPHEPSVQKLEGLYTADCCPRPTTFKFRTFPAQLCTFIMPGGAGVDYASAWGFIRQLAEFKLAEDIIDKTLPSFGRSVIAIRRELGGNKKRIGRLRLTACGAIGFTGRMLSSPACTVFQLSTDYPFGPAKKLLAISVAASL